jgi:transcription initiation factor TFIIB
MELIKGKNMRAKNIREFSSTRKCPECGSNRLIEDNESAEIVCIGCGYVVLTELTNQGPEWRAFDAEQRTNRERVGDPVSFTIHDKGLSTTIDWQDRDSRGQSFPHGQKAQIYRLRKWQRRIRVCDATERNLSFALSEISKIANNQNLPKNVLETASVIYRKALKQDLVRGRTIQGTTAAAIYVACRQCGLARTLEDLSKASSLNKKEVARSYRLLVNRLQYFIKPVKSEQYITKFCNHLTMQGKTEEVAHQILFVAKELKLISGRGPTAMAAATSYIASILVGERKTQREIAEIAQVTEVTIRNRYKELAERLQFNIYL